MVTGASTVVTSRIGRLDLRGALTCSADLDRLPEARHYVFDFKGMEWVEPFGMLYFASQLRQFKNKRTSSRFQAVGYETHGYPAHMGFFHAFGLSHGKDLGAAPGSLQYVPITAVSVAELERESASEGEDVRETIERHSERLAEVLTRGVGGDLQSTLSYSLREILRNVVEHSKADMIWFAAQHWPERQLVELSILDEGAGIRTSLSRNPHLNVDKDADAIRMALLPGVSGVAYKGGPRQRKDAWVNSGYGLFMTSQLCATGGSFLVCSGDHCLVMRGGREEVMASRFDGTAIRMTIATGEVGNLNGVLEHLRIRGAAIAGELKLAANVTASMSARMLRKDFKA